MVWNQKNEENQSFYRIFFIQFYMIIIQIMWNIKL